MSTRLPKKDKYEITHLYGIARKCDWFVHNYNVLKLSKNQPRNIFISTYKGDITIPFFASTVLPTLTTPVILVVASEDYTFPHGHKDLRHNMYTNIQHEVYLIINSPIVDKIYVENLDTIHPKLHPIPLGMYPVFDIKYLNRFMPHQLNDNMSWERPIDIFCNHRIGGGAQYEDRRRVESLCKTSWKSLVTWKDNLNNFEFRNTLLRSKFVICVHGGGIDPSPRAWEALLCGCVPIIESSTLDSAYSVFPVIFVDTWDSNSITKEKLEQWKKQYDYVKDIDTRRSILHKLRLQYWWDKISEQGEFSQSLILT